MRCGPADERPRGRRTCHGYRRRERSTASEASSESRRCAGCDEALRERVDPVSSETEEEIGDLSYPAAAAARWCRRLGELRFGDLVTPNSHPAIVPPDIWRAVQRMRSPRGRRAKSERLLARLGVLRCGSCGARMVIGSTDQNGKHYYFYRSICTRPSAFDLRLLQKSHSELARGLRLVGTTNLCACSVEKCDGFVKLGSVGGSLRKEGPRLPLPPIVGSCETP